uniref:RPN7 domain-containing protein n=1 Tax=Macrostomum lignano TaxID=282301 RepID=A0A1I8H308_9PLAT
MVEPMVVDILNDVEQNENVQPAAGAIVQNANLDLDLIVSSYTGYARYQRLIYIADHCPPLRVQALTMTLNYLKSETLDVQAYVECHRKLVASAPAGQAPAQDTQWVEATRKLAQLSLEKLDVELRSSKQSAIKESIRRGQDELAFHFLRMGDLSSALKNYSRTREYCTNHLQELDMCLNVIRISVYSCNWQHAKSHITKAEACSGVEVGRSLGAGGYPGDASALTSAAPSSKPKEREAVQFDFFNCPELLSPANIATYASLCALATFDRQDMRRLVMSSANFRQFLEVEPAVRDVVTSFHQVKMF